jgi:hypothetical protein
VYAIDPILLFHCDPTVLKRASLLAGELIVSSPAADKHGMEAAGLPAKSDDLNG